MNCRKEPAHLTCSEGLVNKICRQEPVRLKYSEGLVKMYCGSSSMLPDGKSSS